MAAQVQERRRQSRRLSTGALVAPEPAETYAGGRAVEARLTSDGPGRRTMVSATRWPSASAITDLTAAFPIAAIGIRTVVSGGSRYWATGASWKAITET